MPTSTSDEQTLLEAFRCLSPQSKAEVLQLARALRGERRAAIDPELRAAAEGASDLYRPGGELDLWGESEQADAGAALRLRRRDC